MADNTTVSGAVEVKENSRERVAFDLMTRIAHVEDSPNRKGRDYWLTLYRQCWKATQGWTLADIREEK